MKGCAKLSRAGIHKYVWFVNSGASLELHAESPFICIYTHSNFANNYKRLTCTDLIWLRTQKTLRNVSDDKSKQHFTFQHFVTG